jgi:hypothetical protein
MRGRLSKLITSKHVEVLSLAGSDAATAAAATAAAIRIVEDLVAHCDAAEAREGRKALHDALLSLYVTSMTTTCGYPATVAQLGKTIHDLAILAVEET